MVYSSSQQSLQIVFNAYCTKKRFYVVTVEGFETEQEAIQLANDSIYGLAGAVFSNIFKAQRVANKLKLGTVRINDFHPYFAQAPWWIQTIRYR